jgi:hypothetical protein
MINVRDFQPGDGTRYLVFAEMTPPGQSAIGFSSAGTIVFGVVNMGHLAHVSVDGFIFYGDLARAWRTANPWTIRAMLLWLRREAKEHSWPLEVSLQECPVGDDR